LVRFNVNIILLLLYDKGEASYLPACGMTVRNTNSTINSIEHLEKVSLFCVELILAAEQRLYSAITCNYVQIGGDNDENKCHDKNRR